MADRIARLAASVRRSTGEWTTGRVRRWYREAGIDAPKRATARGDLKRLVGDGVLKQHDQAGRRYYVVAGGERGE